MVDASSRNDSILEALRILRSGVSGTDANLTALKATTAVASSDRSGLMVHARFSASSQTVKVRPAWFVDVPGDADDGKLIAIGDELTFAGTSLQDESSKYVAPAQFVPNFGFAKLRLLVTSAPGSGTADLYVAEVQQ